MSWLAPGWTQLRNAQRLESIFEQTGRDLPPLISHILNGGSITDRPLPIARPSNTPASTGGGASPINLSNLLGFGGNGEELDGMGDLFRTLLALQGQGGGKNDLTSLFSGIEL